MDIHIKTETNILVLVYGLHLDTITVTIITESLQRYSIWKHSVPVFLNPLPVKVYVFSPTNAAYVQCFPR